MGIAIDEIIEKIRDNDPSITKLEFTDFETKLENPPYDKRVARTKPHHADIGFEITSISYYIKSDEQKDNS